VPALEQAINQIIRRHEALRTIFPDVEGWPTQVILPEQPITLLVTDLSALPKSKAKVAQHRLASAEAERSFDLSTGPLIRAGVRRMNEREHMVQVTMHHIVSDGWSLGVFCREVSALYEAFAAGNPTPLPALRIQYGDFAAWQRQHMQGDKLARQRSYWKKQLAGMPPVLELPSDRPRPEVATFHGAKFRFMLPKTLSDNLNTLSRQEGVTLFMVLLAAFDVLLYRYTYQPDIVVGTAIANRSRSETEPLMGFFVNLVIMRTDMNGNTTFRELLARVKQLTLAAYQHQDVPIEQIIEMLQPQRSLNRSPLYQVEFTLQNAPLEPLETRDLTFTPVNVQPDSSETDFNLIMSETKNGLAGEIIYSTDLFEPPTIERMADHFRTLLQGIVEEPQRRIMELSLTSNREAEALLAQWDGGATSAVAG
jgi:non-ribosomal peptide synthetase component F